MATKRNTPKDPASPNKMMISRTLVLMLVCGIALFILLGIRLFRLQVLDHDMYEAAAVDQQLRETTVSAKRGTIYDRNMNILAMSASVNNIYISPAEMNMYGEDPATISSALSSILGLDYYSILEKTANKSSWYVTIAKKVDDETAARVRAFKDEGYDTVDDNGKLVHRKYYGVKIEDATKRYYPYSSLASHVIGFVGSDDYGLSGIEFYYDALLSGTDGRIVRATTANGTDMLFTNFEDYYDAEDGQSLVLTIDESVQFYLEKHLAQAVEDYSLRNGAAGIVMDVKTGAILGMASMGNFDLNNYLEVNEDAQRRAGQALDEVTRDAILEEERQLQWRNKAISDTYEPGSTFKIITLAMALESGAVDMDDGFYCGGAMDVPGRDTELKCWNTAGHGQESLTEAVMNSCNIAFVNIGQKVGAREFYKYARAFGFFEKTGIDLTGESGSIWWDEDTFFDKYNLSQLAAASFGQTFTITPIQLITAVSAVANGGHLMTPYLVSAVLDEDGGVVEQHEPKVVRQVVSEQTSRQVCQILEQVVGNKAGTGKNAYVPGYRVGGKTGTSENVVLETITGQKQYIVSFVGIAPSNDPEVAVLVLLENPDPECGVYTSGGQMAAPTVGGIMADILPALGVERQFTENEAAFIDRTVPRVTKKTLPEAQKLLEDNGLTYRVVGGGATVTAQMPKSGVTVAANSEIVLYCNEEPVPETLEMLDLYGLDYETARIRMGWSGLYINGEGALFGESSALITKQSVEPGADIEKGSVVTVTLSDSSNLGRY